jgi:hypothetical protein
MSRGKSSGNGSRLKVVKAIVESGELHSFSQLLYFSGTTRDER